MCNVALHRSLHLELRVKMGFVLSLALIRTLLVRDLDVRYPYI